MGMFAKIFRKVNNNNSKNSIFEFIAEEKLLSLLFIISTIIIFVYIFANEKIESFYYGVKIVNFLFNISIAIFIGIIFYFLQVFYPKRNIRLIANRDTNLLINELLHNLFFNILNYYYPNIKNYNNQAKIYNDKNAELIVDSLMLDEVINRKWNRTNKTWFEEINKTVKTFDIIYEKIIVKYVNVISWEMLKNLEHINRNAIFINSREGILSQSDINLITIKKIFFCMANLKELSKKSYSLKYNPKANTKDFPQKQIYNPFSQIN